ncbi:MAG: LacI family DNA-binding transcriptional regulator [Anaerolineales bacterium]
MAPSLKDIAKDAEVSIATVSRVLSQSRPVSASLRERVLASADRLGYRPNLLARGLRTSRTRTLACVIPSISNPYFTDIVRAVEDTALAAGYVVMVFSSDQDVSKEREHFLVLRSRMSDGALVAVADRSHSDLSLLLDANYPVVLIDRQLDNANLDSVTVDARAGARAAVRYLYERGYRRIGIITGPDRVSTSLEKLRGYCEGLTDSGMAYDERLVYYGDYTEASGLAQGRRLLEANSKPDAMLVSNNLMTAGLYRALAERGARVPGDLAVIGFDDGLWASLVAPPLSVVEQPTYELGCTATEMLLQRIEAKQPIAPRAVVLPTRLILRDSA